MLGNQIRSQNLINQVSSATVQRPKGFYVAWAIDLLGIIAALITGLLYKTHLTGGMALGWVVGAALAYTVVATLGGFLSDNIGRRTLIILFESLAFGFFFYDHPIPNLLGATGTIFALRTVGELMARREFGNELEIRFFKGTRLLLTKLMSGIILGGLLLYLPSWTAEKAFFSEQQFKAVYDGSAELAERFYADVRFDSTVQHFIESIAARELRRIPDFGKSSEAEREALYEKIEAQVAETVRSSFGSGFNTDQTLREALYAFLLSLLNEWKASLGSEFLVAWTAGAFLLFRGIGVIFYFAAAVMAFLIYQLMLAANIVYVQGENHIREVVRFT